MTTTPAAPAAEIEPAAWMYEQDGCYPEVRMHRLRDSYGRNWTETPLYTADQLQALIEERDRLREEVEALASDMSRARDAANEHLNEADRLREALKRLREERSENFNDHGLVPCPKCDSASGPHLYWWQRGQAWLAICSNCKHEAHARESHEYQARNIWNEEARAALAGEKQ